MVREVIYATISRVTFLQTRREKTSAQLWTRLADMFENKINFFKAASRSVHAHAEKRAENAMVIAGKRGEEPEEKMKEKNREVRTSARPADEECYRRGGGSEGQEPQEEETKGTDEESDIPCDISYPREDTPALSTPRPPRTVDLANKPPEIYLETPIACEMSTKNTNPREITPKKEDKPTYIEKCEYITQKEYPKPRKTECEVVKGHKTDIDEDSASYMICGTEKRSGAVEGNAYHCRNSLPIARTVQIEGKNAPHISSPSRSIENKVVKLPRANRHVLKALGTAPERSNNRPKPPEIDCATGKSSSKPLSQATKIRSDEPPDTNRRDRKPLGTAIERSSDQGKPPENDCGTDAPSSRPPRQKTEIRSDESPDMNRRELKPYRTALQRANNQPKRMKNGRAMDIPSSKHNISISKTPPNSPSSKDHQSDIPSDLESHIRRDFRARKPPGSYSQPIQQDSPILEARPAGIDHRDPRSISGEDRGLVTNIGGPTHLSNMVNDVEPRGSVQEEPTIAKSAVKRPNRDISTSTIIHTRFAHIKMIQQYILLLYQVYFTYLQAQIPPSRLRGSVEIQAHLQYLT
ncbi:hypothetical protein BD779DRAFT_265154 [Infundibulicybe gibba]|nr:hypothetical protein BD779DRAFT_265154 [Infundibulicybe gibba]